MSRAKRDRAERRTHLNNLTTSPPYQPYRVLFLESAAEPCCCHCIQFDVDADIDAVTAWSFPSEVEIAAARWERRGWMPFVAKDGRGSALEV